MDHLKKALREASKEDKIAIIAMAINEDPDILEDLENEGFLKDKGGAAAKWLGKKVKERGPGVAKAVGKTGLKALEKTGEVATGTVIGAAKGAYKSAKSTKR